jgi:hypothetical protein
MSDMNRWLKEGDPLAGEPGLSAIDAQAMRRAIVAAANAPTKEIARWWPGPLVLAAGMAACLIIGISAGLRFQPAPGSVAETPAVPAAIKAPPRQMQFVTAGGTRVIWTFTDDFKL